MDLTDEAGRASTCRANSAPDYLPTGTIADLAGTDTKVVFVAHHQTTIGSRTWLRKARNAVRVMQRGNTCAGEDTAISDLQPIAGDGSWSVERERRSEKAPLADLDGTPQIDLKQCADKNLGTKFRKRETRFILQSVPFLGKRPNPARLSDILFSFQFGLSGSPAALETLRWRLDVPGQRPTTRSDRTMLRPGIEARWKRSITAGSTIFRRQVWCGGRAICWAEDLRKRAEDLQKLCRKKPER
jgi:hypothetical protein